MIEVNPQPRRVPNYNHPRDLKWDVEDHVGVRTDAACAEYLRRNRPCPVGDRAACTVVFDEGSQKWFWKLKKAEDSQ